MSFFKWHRYRVLPLLRSFTIVRISISSFISGYWMIYWNISAASSSLIHSQEKGKIKSWMIYILFSDETYETCNWGNTDMLEGEFSSWYKIWTSPTPFFLKPPFGDTDDRIRFIADQLGLRTIIWKYDSFDWTFGTGEVTKAQIDANYQNIMDRAKSGTFASVSRGFFFFWKNLFEMVLAGCYYVDAWNQ